jgi:hypothetical protein
MDVFEFILAILFYPFYLSHVTIVLFLSFLASLEVFLLALHF